jgi:AraC-like DNA-binding protein
MYTLKRFSEVLQYADSIHTELERLLQLRPDAKAQMDFFIEEYFRAVAHANLGQPQQSLAAIRRAEALFNPQRRGSWYENVIDEMYVEYYLALKNYDKALEYIERTLQFYEDNEQELDLLWKQREKAAALSEKGDHRTANGIYRNLMERTDSLKLQEVYSQLNELRTLYELDKLEMEAERRAQALRRQRMMITGLTFACLGLLLIVGLMVWNRRRMMEKNRALYSQIKEYDSLKDAAKSTASAQTGDKRQRQLAAKFHEYLLNNQTFTAPSFDIDEAAAQLVSNRTSLYEAVKAVTGKTPQEYINELKLNEARRLLEATAESQEGIIVQCGFASRSTFFRLFREQYHMPPAEYRRIAKISRG